MNDLTCGLTLTDIILCAINVSERLLVCFMIFYDVYNICFVTLLQASEKLAPLEVVMWALLAPGDLKLVSYSYSQWKTDI